MKFFKKVNTGLILAIIAILCVVIYCAKTEISRKSAKVEIVKKCEDFINLTNTYSILPKEYQVIGEKSTDVNLKTYNEEISNKLNEIMSNNESVNIQKTILSQLLNDQLVDTSKITTSFERKINKISKYSFDGNQVTVTFDSKVIKKQKYNDVDEQTGKSSEKINETSFDLKDETMILEKKDGNWKVVYSNLQFQNVNSLYGIR